MNDGKEEKIWLITGCSQGGLGHAMAKAALEAGDKVAAATRHPEQVRDLVEAYGNRVLPLELEVTSLPSIRKGIQQALGTFGRLDVLVNNAGYAYRAALEEGEEEKIRQLYEINLFGPLHLMQEVLPVMRKQKEGTIVNFSSIAGVSAAVGSSFYASTKAALELLSDGLRKEVSSLGIRVMIVEPGAFRTHFRGNLQESNTRLKAYADTAWKTRPEVVRKSAPEEGNPEKAGQVIVQVVHQQEVPLRLQLGSDAVDFVRKCYADRLAEVEQYESLARTTDF
ncbi:SDR family oxidoreductase [Acidaminococcus fermentans]|uniref:SDR family oxidoreductase n=1 Tax=Acidaminococcus fermentans TaxID=905 RepID=UPI00242AB64E|nr:SDR family oxidoreductase [Acidaminococcus fermentans]